MNFGLLYTSGICIGTRTLALYWYWWDIYTHIDINPVTIIIQYPLLQQYVAIKTIAGIRNSWYQHVHVHVRQKVLPYVYV